MPYGPTPSPSPDAPADDRPSGTAAAPGGAAVQAEGLGKRFGSRWALAHVRLDLARGRSLLLLGPNGSGKTTLLKLLATAWTPTLGTLRLLGADPARDREALRRRIGMLGHGSYLYEALTARENLEFACAAHGRRPGSLERVRDALERVGLGPRAGDPVRGFSAGMRRRLSLARLLLQDPELVLMDEPYGALDSSGFALVDAVISEMRAASRTLVVSTHLAERSVPLCDEALVLSEGRVGWRGPAGDAAAAFRALEAGA